MIDPKKLMLCEHPRSGGNYIHALISKNFYNEDWTVFDSTHAIPSKLDPNRKYVYLIRDTISTLKSVFEMRDMFNLKVDAWQDFLDNTYSQMWISFIPTTVHMFRFYVNKKKKSKHEYSFQNIDMTPIEYYNYYHKCLQELYGGNSNIIEVNYESLMLDFENTMHYLGRFFGDQKDTYINIKKRVGLFPLDSWRERNDL